MSCKKVLLIAATRKVRAVQEMISYTALILSVSAHNNAFPATHE
jgi:hypothetical protein